MSEITVLAMSDDPRITSGFGTVNNEVYPAFHDAGYNLIVIGTLADGMLHNDRPYEIIQTCDHDLSGLSFIDKAVARYKPDVFWTHADPGTNHYRIAKLQNTMQQIPVVAYFPVEGEPISGKYLNFVGTVQQSGGTAVAYTKWGAETIKFFSGDTLNVQYAHLGVDHAPFAKFDDATRAHMKKLVGWGDKFVISFRGRNKRTKNQLALLHAMRRLKEKGLDDIVLYLHCQAFEGYMLDGYNLEEWRDLYQLDNVVFPPDMKRQLDGAPFKSTIDRNWLSINPPNSDQAHRLMLAGMDIIERQNLCDLFVDPSQVEGFGLPPLEAAACGVPVVSVNDRGVRQEVLGDAAYWMEPDSYTFWHTGSKLWIVNDETLATTIEWFYKDWKAGGELLRHYSQVGMERAAMFKWQPTRELFVDLIDKAYRNKGRVAWMKEAKQ